MQGDYTSCKEGRGCAPRSLFISSNPCPRDALEEKKMEKIPSLFKRNYEGNRLVYDEVVEGSEWVLKGEGIATVKFDGTACMIKEGKLYKRFDRKKNKKTGEYKGAPAGWIPCEDEPNEHTGHWPGWLLVGEGAEDKWHREVDIADKLDGTYELLGPKIQGNPHGMLQHVLWLHGGAHIKEDCPRTFDTIRSYLSSHSIEGIVWHHSDGRMVKIKAKDFGLPWPPRQP